MDVGLEINRYAQDFEGIVVAYLKTAKSKPKADESLKELREILGLKESARNKSGQTGIQLCYPFFIQEKAQLQERADGYPYLTRLIRDMDRSVQTIIRESIDIQESFVGMSFDLLDDVVRTTCKEYGIVIQDVIEGQVLVERTFIPPPLMKSSNGQM